MSYRSESRVLHSADIPQSWSGASADVLNASLVDLYRASSRTSEGALFRDGMDVQTVSTTTTYTAGDDAAILVDSSGGAVTVNLPQAGAVPGRVYYVKKTTSDANTVTIDPSGAETIEGSATLIFGTSGRDSRAIVSDGTQWWVISGQGSTAGAVGASLYARASTELNIVNDATEQAIFSFTVAANDLASNRALYVYLGGDYLNNSGAGRTFTWRVRLGATVLYADPTIALPVSANRRAWSSYLLVGNQATNDQTLFGVLFLGNSNAPVTGIGDLAGGGFANSGFAGAAAEDTTTSLTFSITIQHSAANANLSLRRQYAMALLV